MATAENPHNYNLEDDTDAFKHRFDGLIDPLTNFPTPKFFALLNEQDKAIISPKEKGKLIDTMLTYLQQSIDQGIHEDHKRILAGLRHFLHFNYALGPLTGTERAAQSLRLDINTITLGAVAAPFFTCGLIGSHTDNFIELVESGNFESHLYLRELRRNANRDNSALIAERYALKQYGVSPEDSVYAKYIMRPDTDQGILIRSFSHMNQLAQATPQILAASIRDFVTRNHNDSNLREQDKQQQIQNYLISVLEILNELGLLAARN